MTLWLRQSIEIMSWTEWFHHKKRKIR